MSPIEDETGLALLITSRESNSSSDKKKMLLSHRFGYDSNMIRMSRNVVPVTGNSKGVPTKKEEIE